MTPATWPHGDPNALAHAILARPAYRDDASSIDEVPDNNWLSPLWTYLDVHLWKPFVAPLLHKLFGGLAHSFGGASTFGSIAGLVLVIAAVGGLIYAIVRLVLAFARPQGPRPRGFHGVPLGERGSVEAWRGVALDAAARGDFRFAIAALFAAAVALLDDGDVVRFDAARTAGEYRRIVRRARPRASTPFDDLAGRFVRASYAEVTASADDFAGALAALDTFAPALAANGAVA